MVNIVNIFERGHPEITGLILTSVSGKSMEKIILDAIEKHLKEQVISHSQHNFMRENSCLLNLISLMIA